MLRAASSTTQGWSADNPGIYLFPSGRKPLDGKVASLIVPWLDTETMSLFLKHAAIEFAGDLRLMFLDRAGWYRGGNLKIPPSIKLSFLLHYNPELNPVKTLWNHLRENYFANRVFESLDQLEDELIFP